MLVFRLFSFRSRKANNEYRRRSRSAISAAVPKMVRHEGGGGYPSWDEEKGDVTLRFGVPRKRAAEIVVEN